MSQQPAYDGGSLQDLHGAADESVKAVLGEATNLRDFLRTTKTLSLKEMELIVEQAIILLESFYVHLPLKRAMHAIDPLQRLRLLQRRLIHIPNESAFHYEMIGIFTLLRDLHTNYVPPSPFAEMVAFLPFRVQACYEGDKRKYIVSSAMKGFSHATFGPGVEIVYWNGVPIERAVEIAALRHAGGNLAARHARGVAGLTTRAMNSAPPPDEEWVVARYKDLNGQEHEFRADWAISRLPDEKAWTDSEMSMDAAAAIGLDLEGETCRRINKMLFAQHVFAAERDMESGRAAAMAHAGADGGAIPEMEKALNDFKTTMPDAFAARAFMFEGEHYGYVRIYTFYVTDDRKFVNEFLRLIELPDMPKHGLIIDVRGNGGGLIWAGERLLQLLTPRTIEPCRLQFINTAANLRLCRTDKKLSPWLRSLERALESGAAFSAAFPITAPEKCNDIGQRYYGPVVLMTDARCYSTTDIFAAGFKDHEIGKILGVDGNTGAGGANVWTLKLIRSFFEAGQSSPLQELPRKADMRVAIRRTLRVGTEAGTELEDFGVEPDERHNLTANDLLNGNPDLIAHAARMLAAQTKRRFDVSVIRNGPDVQVDVAADDVAYVDVFVDDRMRISNDVRDGAVHLSLNVETDAKIEIRGYKNSKMTCCRRISI